MCPPKRPSFSIIMLNISQVKINIYIPISIINKNKLYLKSNCIFCLASKALDALMVSKFGQGDDCLFATRELAIEFLDTMLVHKFFHRAKKVPVTDAELRRGKKPMDDGTATTTRKETTSKKTTKNDGKVTDAESSHVECGGKSSAGTGVCAGDAAATKVEKEKKKRKIRLDMHPDQVFVDGPEAYVWIYDPIPMHYWLFGALLVVGAIVICMFPLWPPSLRFVFF